MKKNITLVICLALFSSFLFSQVGIGTTNPDLSASLHIESTTTGLLIPRITETQKNAIGGPATGLLIYQTNNNDGFWYYSGTQWLPLKNNYSFINGLNETGNIAKLGGNLTENTLITLNSYNLSFKSVDYFSNFNLQATVGGFDRNVIEFDYLGDFVGHGIYRDIIFFSDYNQDVFRIGHEFGTLVDDGTAYNIDGFTGTTDYVVKMYDGFSSRGTAMGIGSIEYLVDGEATLGSSVNFVPLIDGYNTLGTSLNRWAALYAVNGVIQTSDKNLKKNINSINYGINEIMKLKPVSYQWKRNTIGNTTIKEHEKETKLGFLAQDVLEIIPEVVKTHEWKILDEKKPQDFTRVKNDRLGMNYSEIIPVLVKAMQEQQREIDLLKSQLREKQ